jgi:hypothetical protein
MDEVLENNDKEPAKLNVTSLVKSPIQAELKVHIFRPGVSKLKALTNMQKIETAKQAGTSYPPRSDEDEPPQSVIHAPAGFGRFVSPTRHKQSNAKG